jgi:hypothetical protein
MTEDDVVRRKQEVVLRRDDDLDAGKRSRESDARVGAGVDEQNRAWRPSTTAATAVDRQSEDVDAVVVQHQQPRNVASPRSRGAPLQLGRASAMAARHGVRPGCRPPSGSFFGHQLRHRPEPARPATRRSSAERCDVPVVVGPDAIGGGRDFADAGDAPPHCSRSSQSNPPARVAMTGKAFFVLKQFPEAYHQAVVDS